MNSTIQKVILVGGSGHLGPFLLKALEADGYDVTVVSRHNSSATFEPDTKVVKVTDGYPDDEMVDVFKGADAVVLSLGFGAMQRHEALVDASIKAGVKHLIASTFGCTDRNAAAADLFLKAKQSQAIVKYMRSKETSGWTWTSINCGLFFDMCIATGFFGFDLKEHTATIWDDGNFQFSATTRATIGTAVARVLAKPQETANRSVFISSFDVSMNEILSALKKATGVSDWKTTHVKTEDMIEKGRAEWAGGSMWGLAKLALATHLRPEYGANFKELGLLDNELLGLATEDVYTVVAHVVKV